MLIRILIRILGKKLVLYGQRINAELHNAECLSDHPGEMYTYDAVDSQLKSREFDNFIAAKVRENLI